MMYRWSPSDIEALKDSINWMASELSNDSPRLKTLRDLNEDLGSILAVMESTNQDYVYIVGRDPNKT